MPVKRNRTIDTAGLSENGDLKVLAQMQLLSSIISSRTELMSRMGKSFGGKRDLYEALGYPLSLTFEDYYSKYQRQDVAARLIDLPVDGSWQQKPEIVEDVENETQFEKSIQTIIKEKKLFHILRRSDILSGIGQYAVILVGVNDGNDLREPLGKAKELLYLQPYSEGNAEISQWDKDPQSSRYGMPLFYKLKIVEPGNAESYQQKEVHHSRIIHIADGLLESNVYGTPRLQRVYNRLLCLELVVGGSAEMFWQGAFPGMFFGSQPDADISMDADGLKEQIDKYVHGLKRYLTMQGIDAKSLAPNIASPKDSVDVQMTMISVASGIPKRILEGSERGELSSGQDESNWNDRLKSRQSDFIDPIILRPVIDKLIECGVLQAPAKGEYTIIWPDLNAASDKDKTEIGKARVEMLKGYAGTPGVDMLVPPRQFFEEIMDLDVDKVDRLMDAIDEDALAGLREEDVASGAMQTDQNNADNGQQNV